MAKAQSPLLGYNNNVRHRGQVFHIQTEDSGVARPHVITHLFADGGRVVKSAKTSYADRVTEPNLGVFVKKLMQDQHKAMFIALRDGSYDAMILSGAAPVAAPLAATAAAPDVAPAPALAVEAKSDVVAASPEDSSVLEVSVSEALPSDGPPPIVDELPDPARVFSAPIIDLDVDGTVELAPEELSGLMAEMVDDGRPTMPSPEPIGDLSFSGPPLPIAPAPPSPRPTPPPPPPQVAVPPLRLAVRPPGASRFTPSEPIRPGSRTPAPMVPAPPIAPPPQATAQPLTAPGPRGSSPPPLPVASRAPAAPGRYAAPRPAAPAAAGARPREVHASIFAESLVSERSLDEVILAYLAEELGGTPPRT